MLTTTQKQELVTSHMNLAYKLSRNFEKTYPLLSFESIASEALYALAKAAENFNASRGAAFSTLAYSTITNRLIDFCQKENQQEVMIAKTWGYHPDGKEKELPEPSALDEGFASVEFHETFYAFIFRCLNQEERILFLARYAGKTQAECAKELTDRLGKRYTQKKVCYMLSDMLSRYHDFIMTY